MVRDKTFFNCKKYIIVVWKTWWEIRLFLSQKIYHCCVQECQCEHSFRPAMYKSTTKRLLKMRTCSSGVLFAPASFGSPPSQSKYTAWWIILSVYLQKWSYLRLLHLILKYQWIVFITSVTDLVARGSPGPVIRSVNPKLVGSEGTFYGIYAI